MRQKDNFMDDEEKINDLFLLSKIDFLRKYNVSKMEYENTINRIKTLIDSRIKYNNKQRIYREANLEEERRKQREYHRQNKDKINARRKFLYSLKSKDKKDGRYLRRQFERQLLMEYAILHKEEIEELKAYRQYEKNQLYNRMYYYSKLKQKRQEAKLNGK